MYRAFALAALALLISGPAMADATCTRTDTGSPDQAAKRTGAFMADPMMVASLLIAPSDFT